MALNTLRDLYVEQLRDLYSAENQILKSLPKMAEAAKHPELRQAFESHVTLTEEHVRRLEQIFTDLGEKGSGHHCKGMEGLLKEANDTVKEKGDSDVLDAAMIANAQRVEHYEIAGYGCVRTYARMLGREQDATLIQQTLDEEGTADEQLTTLAERVINVDALHDM
ncbi:MAG TPA: ferritin-like domain-containing protein [Longimicrobium sp.]|nr:ferritin-like domain-containing protein [Longimicrobium sp.]